MATDRNRKRLENIEMALTPRELLACCIEERSKFASRAEYAAWLAEDSKSVADFENPPADRDCQRQRLTRPEQAKEQRDVSAPAFSYARRPGASRSRPGRIVARRHHVLPDGRASIRAF